MPSSPFLESLQRFMVVRRYSKRSIETYLYWIKYYIRFNGRRHPSELGNVDIERFLTRLAVDRTVSAATQRVALNAVAFLYNRFLGQPVREFGDFRHARRQRKLPVVLSKAEAGRLLSRLSGVRLLMASLLYGSGLRRIELVRLRVKDVDFDQLSLHVWFGKGFKHRITTLAPELVPSLQHQISRVCLLLEEDRLINGYTGVWMPDALGRKYPRASLKLGWHYLFPSHRAGAAWPSGRQNH